MPEPQPQPHKAIMWRIFIGVRMEVILFIEYCAVSVIVLISYCVPLTHTLSDGTGGRLTDRPG